MVESSFPPFRVGAAAIPDSIFITRQRMIPWRCLTMTPPFLNPPSLGTLNLPGGSLWLVPGPTALLLLEGCPSGSRSCLGLSMSRGPRGDQSVQHPADRAIVHSGSPYPSVLRGIWGIEAALRSLSQRATPAAVMLASASSQEERHGLGRLPSPLGGGSLHPDWRPRDMNCALVDRSRSAGREEMSNPLRIANSS